MSPARMTVVIPTRDRADRLRRCLSSLGRQTIVEALEVVVVDDGSADAEGVVRAATAFPGARVTRIAGGGVAAARNAGVAAAGAELVAFTDDDCEPAEDWAEVLCRRLDTGCAAVAGTTVNGLPDDPLAAAAQLVANSLLDDPVDAVAPGSNIACRRSAALLLPFDESYVGIGAEDRDWFARLAAAGLAVEREPGAIVRHRPTVTWTGFLRKSVAYGRGAYRFRRVHRDGHLESPAFYARLLRRGFRSGLRVGIAVTLAQAATALGFGMEALSVRRSGQPESAPEPDVSRAGARDQEGQPTPRA